MGRSLTKWDADTHMAILMAMCHHMKPTKADCVEIAAICRKEGGYTFTGGALRYGFILHYCWSDQVVGSQTRTCGTRLSDHRVRISASMSPALFAGYFFFLSSRFPQILLPTLPRTTHTSCPLRLHTHLKPFSISTMAPGRVPSGKPATIWDHEAHLTLLQAIIESGTVKVADWDAIIPLVNRRGYYYTAGAAM
ncbi:hypothetical protein QBC40DRAFT_248801 [Triangularia verruculosa]|uniref:Uncharacterized protein n=1 Tax=Triangularia verruculosa TaxID=2587418 RepID=A0AAN6XXU6_9PEZI|nr:hypothetical protein QBC40DRAFT_248801 [Triangularia verruculosa]